MTQTKTHVRSVAAALLILCFILGVGVQAEDSGHRHKGAHVHGVAYLNLAAEDTKILVELTSPAASLIGFERAPRTDDERATLALAKQNLMAGDAMIRFNTEAGCRLENAEIDAEFADAGHSHDHDTHNGETAHADFHVSYAFDCERPDELGSAALGLFVGFPALERVLVQYVTADGQGGAELTRSQAVVSFVPL
jgi:hypothetical protein